MGLDAFVPCNCFEEGRISRPPEPFRMDDLYRDEEGYICSRRLDRYCEELGYSRYIELYGKLDDAFHSWTQHACEHEDGEYLSEWVSNWPGVRKFQSIVEELGGEERYPALSQLIPNGNGGSYPAVLASNAIKEIDDLVERAKTLVFHALICDDSEEPLWTSADCGSYPMTMTPCYQIWMVGDSIHFIVGGREYVSRRFRQEPVGPVYENGDQPMTVFLSETGESFRITNSVGPYDAPKVSREFWVEPREAPFMHEGSYYTAERTRSLLVASAETGNPIYWC